MVQIIPEIRKPTFSEKLGTAVGTGIEDISKLYQKKQENKALKQLTGMDLGNLPPEAQQEFIKQFSKAQAQQQLLKSFGFSQEKNELSSESENKSPEKEQKSTEFDFEKLSPSQKAAMDLILPNVSKGFREDQKIRLKRESEERKQSFELAKPTLDRARTLTEDLPYKENAAATMKEAIASGKLGMFSLDNLAEISGIEGLRSPEGALFKTASKEFFLGNLSRVGSRGLNQMMERVVLEMSPLIGRKTEANLAVTEILDAENDVTKKEVELTNHIAQEFKNKHGFYPEDLSARVYKELRPYAIQRQKDAMKQVENIKDRYRPKSKEGILMRDPSGALRRVPQKDIKAAKQAGYKEEK